MQKSMRLKRSRIASGYSWELADSVIDVTEIEHENAGRIHANVAVYTPCRATIIGGGRIDLASPGDRSAFAADAAIRHDANSDIWSARLLNVWAALAIEGSVVTPISLNGGTTPDQPSAVGNYPAMFERLPASRRVEQFLADSGPSTVDEIVAGTRLKRKTVTNSISMLRDDGKLPRAPTLRGPGRVRLYELVTP